MPTALAAGVRREAIIAHAVPAGKPEERRVFLQIKHKLFHSAD
jgi:hypothetical protein